MAQDRRTEKIRELRNKLTNARGFIRDFAFQCVEMEDGKVIGKAFWGKRAIRELEDTKEI